MANTCSSPLARLSIERDLVPLLELFRVSEVSSIANPIENAEEIWAQTLSCGNSMVFVAEADDLIVATCMLIVAPNLLREGQQHGFLENVVTHPDYRGKGYGRSVVQAALNEAWEKNCYHVLLQSGRESPIVHRFYENCGFIPGLRTGYVAHRP